MRYNLKYRVLCLVTIFVTACNPFQQAKDAAKARKASDSILTEFNKVNEEIKQSNEALIKRNDSLEQYYDSILTKGSMPVKIQPNEGVGAIR